jgi:UDP-N-acetyl-D-galactosamine dehydrogenase
VIEAGVYRAPTIKVAEAAKVIENTQRDLNIALMNELAVIFDKMDIDTQDVLDAAGSKWNFLPFHPGLVGGHCIGVDPYYLTYKAEMMGYQPDVILAGRQINDGMGKFIAGVTIKKMIDADCKIKGAKVLVLGITFKENCEDIRNSRVIDVIEELQSFGVDVVVVDPVASAADVKRVYGIDLQALDQVTDVQAVVAAVPHTELLGIDVNQLALKGPQGMPFIDVKSVFSRDELDHAKLSVWRL